MDARDLPDHSVVRADLCVVGAGAAGITLALEFAGTPIDVVVLETGGLTAEPGGQGIHTIVAGSTSTLSVDPTRTTYFGGNTNHWSANCRPLEEEDFEPHDWVPHSGWPIRRQHLLPYYERAQSICGLNGFRSYDPDTHRAQLIQRPFDPDPPPLVTRVMQGGQVRSFAELHGERLKAAANVRVLFHANALRLTTNANADHVEAVETVGAGGRRLRIEANVVVVAAGGIENARLMLCSNDVNRRGLANDRELVGRFFMDHGYVDIPLGAAAAARNLQFYDSQSAQPIDSARLWAQLVLAQEVRRQERLAGLSLWFQGVPCAALSADAAHTMRRFLSRRASLKQLRTDLRLVLSDPGGVARHALGRNRPGETLRMIAQIEQAPDPENRITLSTELDHVGQPRAQLALRFGAVERSGFLAALRRSTTALGLNGEVLARQAKLLLDAGRFGFFFHHMGTTRMHSDPTRGVVDADCRVHGIANLFIAGSSVFPTAGTAAPTLTIVALALRLADHIRQGRGLRNVP